MDRYVDVIQRHARPLEPIATGAQPVLPLLHGVRAVLFDVYGTLIISGSGDVGTIAAAPGDAFSSACEALGLRLTVVGEEAASAFVETIHAAHEEARRRGIEYPEVDIVAVWETTLGKLERLKQIDGDVAGVDPRRLALEYEMRVNPVWPMPGAKETLSKLKAARLTLGIISNAQFFTPLLFPALLQRSIEDTGFDPALCVYSYIHGQAKPGTFLFEQARRSLASRDVAPGEILYIGNDMLNDVSPAREIGFRTALFAGDKRSLRMRADDRRVAGARPDLVVTELGQLAGALGLDEQATE